MLLSLERFYYYLFIFIQCFYSCIIFTSSSNFTLMLVLFLHAQMLCMMKTLPIKRFKFGLLVCLFFCSFLFFSFFIPFGLNLFIKASFSSDKTYYEILWIMFYVVRSLKIVYFVLCPFQDFNLFMVFLHPICYFLLITLLML